MKKWIALIMAALMCLTFAACGEKDDTETEIDAALMFADLKDNVTYPDTVTELSADMAAMLLGTELPEGIEAYLAINEISNLRCAVFACGDDKGAAAIKLAVDVFLKQMKEVNADYAPEEVARLENARVERSGRFVAVCVTDDTEGADAVFADYFG